MTVQAQVNKHLMEWDKFIRLFREKSFNAAESEANYKHALARFIVEAKARDQKLSQAAAETLADADLEIYKKRLERLQAQHELEAYKAKLTWYREKSQHLRSEKVDERESNRLYADSGAT